ncbi:MAG: hypothetical protein QOE90_3497 [Thermoplasmata archaeon]|jgi:hypothetical protein|nr:hypothetical protein [Thermoplasmata archaeon]
MQPPGVTLNMTASDADYREGWMKAEEQLAAQIKFGGTPGHEHAIHFAIAPGFQSTCDLEPGDLVFEKPFGASCATSSSRCCPV